MKRVLSIILTLTLLLSLISLTASAKTPEVVANENGIVVSENTQQLEDGSSVTVTVYKENNITPYASSYITGGAKVYTMYNSSGNVLWELKAHGTFEVVQGVSSVCINNAFSDKIVEKAWRLYAANTYRADCRSICDAIFKRKLLGIDVESRTIQVILTCDIYGNLS